MMTVGNTHPGSLNHCGMFNHSCRWGSEREIKRKLWVVNVTLVPDFFCSPTANAKTSPEALWFLQYHAELVAFPLSFWKTG